MTVEEMIAARHQALMSLVQCAQCIRDRDKLIRNAVALGVTRVEVARILSMSRQHISEIASRTETE